MAIESWNARKEIHNEHKRRRVTHDKRVIIIKEILEDKIRQQYNNQEMTPEVMEASLWQTGSGWMDGWMVAGLKLEQCW